MAEPPLRVVDLGKVYRRHVGLADLSLQVDPGEVVGLLGPNGAGKTTTVKILTGLVRATSGSASLFGLPVHDPAARRRIGYLPEHFRFPEWLTATELLDVHGRLAGMTTGDRRRRIPEVLATVGLSGRGGDRLRAYSKGMTQRVGLAQALLARPELVLLDEPTSALDPIGRREVRDVIRDLRADGVAVLLNSHLLSEVELTCDRVVIVDRGRVVRSGRLDELVGGAAEIRVRLDRVDEQALALLAGFGDVVTSNGTTVVVAAEGHDPAPAVAAELVRAGYALQALVPVQRSLEQVFVDLVSGSAG
ncbi:MAG: ABC transporter ATP-binding protein [Euzebyales bacterium]|nr:ABC transporter ATP-binding protein [Euzebyales bacterium]MBA3621675.1 ABC transporter ATP-binding protein [Euzebyales bacterium]